MGRWCVSEMYVVTRRTGLKYRLKEGQEQGLTLRGSGTWCPRTVSLQMLEPQIRDALPKWKPKNLPLMVINYPTCDSRSVALSLDTFSVVTARPTHSSGLAPSKKDSIAPLPVLNTYFLLDFGHQSGNLLPWSPSVERQRA